MCRVVLLYGTILYFGFYITIAESLAETRPLLAFIGLFILLLLLVLCAKTFNANNIEEYLPKWFK